ncbi:MAG: AMP-binding protein, partial [Pseudomonadota bacterium]
EQLGLDSARLYGSGSAPISPSTLRWYEQIGINISEGWGMTETGGLSSTNLPFRSERVGTIGKPIPGTEMRIADDGEVQLRSPGLMTGYYNMPDETAETFTEDGFLKTGDKGEWDERVDGYRITGRVKDQFKSAKGKYVSPVPIEARLAGNPLVEQVCVMGTGLRAPVGVVVLAPAARDIDNTEVAASLDGTLNETNTQLEAHEKLGAIAIAPDPWTIENECLTPTLKIKRDVIETQYLNQLADLGSTPVEWLRTNA